MEKLGEEEEKPVTQRRREYTDLGLDLDEREEQVACHADDRRSTSESGDVSLTIIIASVSGSKSFTSFTNRFFHLSRQPGFRMAFDAAKRNGRFDRIQCQRSKESSSRGKRPVVLCRMAVRVEIMGSHSSELSKN